MYKSVQKFHETLFYFSEDRRNKKKKIWGINLVNVATSDRGKIREKRNYK